MKLLPMKRFSLLGLALIAASAVAAAFVPNKAPLANGALIQSDGNEGDLTCTDRAGGAQCFDTASAGTNPISKTSVGSALTSLTGGAANTTAGDVQ